MSDKIEMEAGKIYFLDYGGNTQLVIRYKGSDACNYLYFDCLHNWNGYETFYKGSYCVKSNISEIREASKAEKQSLLRSSIEHGTI